MESKLVFPEKKVCFIKFRSSSWNFQFFDWNSPSGLSELPSTSFEDGFENFDFLFNTFFQNLSELIYWFRTFVENPSACSSKLFSMSTKEVLGIFSGKVIDECSRFWSKDFKIFDGSLPAFLSNLHSACLLELFEKANFWKRFDCLIVFGSWARNLRTFCKKSSSGLWKLQSFSPLEYLLFWIHIFSKLFSESDEFFFEIFRKKNLAPLPQNWTLRGNRFFFRQK